MDYMVLFTLLGSLALLMFGMKVLSEGLQKMTGPQLRDMLQTQTKNRFMAAFTGMFVTASIQSSTATTLMVVSFVNAGLLTLAQAISVILGAHIGTTATGWIMSLGLSLDITVYAFVATFIGIIMIYMKKYKNFGEFLFGFAFIVLGLAALKKTGVDMDLGTNSDIIGFFSRFDADNMGSVFLFLFVGIILTVSVQSSAAVMAITMTLCSIGVLPVGLGVIIVLGENVGTTITSNIAALSANVSARRTAFSHFFVNMIGLVWALILLRPFYSLVCYIVGCDTDLLSSDAEYAMHHSNLVLPAFHTLFNVVNTLIMIWMVPLIEKVVCKVIRVKQVKEDEESRLFFITAGLMQTPELSILNAKKEIIVFSDRCVMMFGFVQQLVNTSTQEEFNQILARIEKYEVITDKMEVQIADYLNKVSEGRLSIESKTKIQHMLRMVSELESIGDSCYKLARSLNRKRQHLKEDFTEKQYEHIQNMMALAEDALQAMDDIVKSGDLKHADFNKSYNLEQEINNYRNQLRNQNIFDINNHQYNYQLGVYYMDFIAECEKLGDYVMNVVESTCLKEKIDARK